MPLEGYEIGRDMWKDKIFEVANHVAEFQVCENIKVVHAEPLLDSRRVFAASSSTIEGRFPTELWGPPRWVQMKRRT